MSEFLRRMMAVLGAAALFLAGSLTVGARQQPAQQSPPQQRQQQAWPTIANREVRPPESWEHHGMDGDAKGQPVQSNYPSHGSAPCLIRKVMVGAAFS